jgi:transposase
MPYILDLIQRVIDLLKDGGMITEAAHIFGIGRALIYGWLSRSKLEATKVKRRQRKLDWKELEKDVKQNPESIISRQS